MPSRARCKRHASSGARSREEPRRTSGARLFAASLLCVFSLRFRPCSLALAASSSPDRRRLYAPREPATRPSAAARRALCACAACTMTTRIAAESDLPSATVSHTARQVITDRFLPRSFCAPPGPRSDLFVSAFDVCLRFGVLTLIGNIKAECIVCAVPVAALIRLSKSGI